MPRGRLNNKEREEIVTRHRAGDTVQAIAQEMHRDKKVVARFLASVAIKDDTIEEGESRLGSRSHNGDEERSDRGVAVNTKGVFVSGYIAPPVLLAPEAGPPERRQFINLHVGNLPDLVQALERAATAEFRTLPEMALYYVDRGLRSDSYLTE